MIRPPPPSTLFPYTTLFRSLRLAVLGEIGKRGSAPERKPRRQCVERAARVAARERSACLFDGDRKSTRLNSSHVEISYAVFCLKKKNALNGTIHPGAKQGLH